MGRDCITACAWARPALGHRQRQRQRQPQQTLSRTLKLLCARVVVIVVVFLVAFLVAFPFAFLATFQVIKQMRANTDFAFSEEYECIETGSEFSRLASQRLDNKWKNRYANILVSVTPH